MDRFRCSEVPRQHLAHLAGLDEHTVAGALGGLPVPLSRLVQPARLGERRLSALLHICAPAHEHTLQLRSSGLLSASCARRVAAQLLPVWNQ